MTKVLNYTLLFRSEPEGGYTVVVPSLPGCVTYGKNLSEAKKMAKDAIEGYLVSLEKHKEPIPTEESVFFSNINVSARLSAYA
ncbi:antitoxin HicB [Candidatus Woesebacteria bacterium RIFCSPHIGHO2_12_FULL_44_11]|uniref:Antitoxin HicB n=1 Tax=Candidatus Woesebacteria bacterium RIFCSPLOWO2_01_FULL_44_14 TaxID=1802525 RepID=A0A1F8BZN8_9BACT|nr:MAG: antitoxin HicB [Candidatus Woesebacteria bacterium RIFCSPHIGHO2_12_FULL_44_11]OGM68768.1 MAG: antitoxin HicB [Candidatus Woesebacteria bacterium RIFCSPLOWO2_01_FULL_44_14]